MIPAVFVPILTYHSIDASGSVLSVAPREFREHVAHLAASGYTAIRLDQLIDAFDGLAPLPPKPVVLTFDDAYANFRDAALPVLREAGFGATVFAVAGLVGRTNEWETKDSPAARMPLLDWPGLREIVAAGMEIGSHAYSHERLDRLPPERLEKEIAGSRRALEDGVGGRVATFAYPFGRRDSRSTAIARATYKAACSTRMAFARPGQDRHVLPRIDVYYLRDPRRFALLGTPAGTAYLAARALGRAARALLMH